jgi:hypothetical protein
VRHHHFARDTPSFRAGRDSASCVSTTCFPWLPPPFCRWF